MKKTSFAVQLKLQYIMSEAKKAKGIYWIISLVSLVATIAFLMFKPEWFWICLPFFLTSTVLAMDVM